MIGNAGRSSLFLALVGWASASVLFMLFVYVPTHTPLTTVQTTIAWLSALVALVASATALIKSTAALRKRTRIAENSVAVALAVPPCVVAAVVAVALVSSP